jgi:hypothetical protein
MPKLCPDCGDDHDMLFSNRVTEIYEAIVDMTDPDDRAELMLELAQVFVEDTDDTDQSLGEDVHDLLSDFIEQRMKFERSSMRLARVLMRTLPAYVEAHADMVVEEDTGPGTSKAN